MSEKLSLEYQVKILREALIAHHQWQCEAEGMLMRYTQGGEVHYLDIAGEYGDSSLYSQTIRALHCSDDMSLNSR